MPPAKSHNLVVESNDTIKDRKADEHMKMVSHLMDDNGRITVLFVDDCEADRVVFERFADRENLPYDIAFAVSCNNACKLLSQQRFDIIITDYFLPDGNAADIIGHVRDTPVIVVTSAVAEDTAVCALKAGAQEYIVKDTQGTYLRILPIKIEIVLRRYRAEMQSQMLSEAVMCISDSVFITDMNDKIIYVNKAFCRQNGYCEKEMLGQPSRKLWEGDERSGLPTVDGPPEGVSPVWHGEFYHRRKDGDPFPISLSRSLIRNESGEPVAIVGVARDITERKKAESELQRAKDAAEAATKAKSEFLARMSHEIRTPMNAIIGMTGLLLSSRLESEQREYVETVRNSGDALLAIINDILDFSKIEAGKLELEHQPFDLRDCIEESLDLLAMKAADKDLSMAYLMDGCPESIIGDITRLRQVLVNLVGNAVKFTDHGEIIVSVTAKPVGEMRIATSAVHDAPGSGTHQHEHGDHAAAHLLNSLHFTVRDTGHGIPEDRIDTIFASFSQADASTTRQYGGTGLGLTISKKLVTMMGGTLWVSSTPGKGTSFHFTILAVSLTKSGNDYLHKVNDSFAGKYALIIEPNATIRSSIEMSVRTWGMVPHLVDSVQNAVRMTSNSSPPPHVALIDSVFIESAEVTVQQRLRDYFIKHGTPLVMLTSYGRGSGLKRVLTYNSYVNKPIKPSQLYDRLVEYFESEPLKVQETLNQAVLDPGTSKRMPLRMLLVEDNMVNQMVALRILEKMGYRADIAANGREAVQAVERQAYDLVFMDMHMPVMDGLEATEKIRSCGTLPNRPWIVAMTANVMKGDRERCLDAGMDDYVTKPVRIKALTAAIEQGYNRHKAATTNASGRDEPTHVMLPSDE